MVVAKKSQKKNTTSSSDTSSNSDNTPKPVTTKSRTRKSIPRHSPPQRSSIYRGVTRHRWTGRYEAHLWDKNCWNESQSKKGRQVYLGAYGDEEAAARAYDLAALKYWGQDTILNFPVSNYGEEFKEMEGQSREEFIGSLRRRSSGFSRGVSKYRGVARHHHNGRWEARIGRVFGNKYLYLGTYATQEEAAIAYDMAAIEYRGLNAVTNFDLSRYIKWLHPKNKEGSITDPIIEKSNTHGDTASFTNPNGEVGLGFGPHQPSSVINDELLVPPKCSDGNGASTALELLLQSPKFKRMLERTSGLDDHHPPTMKDSDSDPPRRTTFPDDIQTFFDCQHDSSCYTQSDHDNIFSAFNSFEDPVFDCELHS